MFTRAHSLARIGALLASIIFTFAPASAQDAPTPGTPEADAAPAQAEAKKWDVSDPPGPRSRITIDVTEGTWMSVDVSPDGGEIVFDLLGDIYVMPIDGGDARALTSGMAWDMQPRFSPCGRWIAFTSDRAGGDNVWVMHRDGSEPKQVSKESFRLLNNPAWSPDGEFIVARKHFTSKRSLGAGEMWLYHRTGGDGVQMTKRPNEQKDVNDPAFSPCGRYLYYSQDTTPGRTFEYSKDSNEGIYSIQRLDTQSGETERFVSGPGGAVRPTPSPDGRSLAFVRRVRFDTCLFVMDLQSGEMRLLASDLERDMQEAWAINGVYPAFAWTPDSASLVLWSGGKVRRIDASTGDQREIPFRVRAEHEIAEALRFPVEVAPDEFDVKMLRWANVSPAGDRVVYQALGHLYVRELPSGTPRRLTSQTDHFEHYPSFSRDGRWVVYTTWNDETLGAVRIVSSTGGEGRTVTAEPGHYVEPCFSPDGSTVVYRKITGGWLRSPAWSRDPGLYRVAASGGEPVRITTRGVRPHFGAENDRVYFLNVESDENTDTRTLRSIDLHGAEERTHLTTTWASDFRVSPDGRWVAWVEGFNAYVAPFVRAGLPVAVGPKSTSIPVRRVSRDAGDYLHWSGDSASLHWLTGPELFTRPLTDAFAFLEGSPDELPEPPEHGLNISFRAAADAPTGDVALVGARIVTMRADEVIEDGVVVVEGNRIAAVGPRASVRIPSGAHVVDVRGHTIMPGIIDAHAHGAKGSDGFVPQRNWLDYASLAFGTTTIHDPSNDTHTVFAAREMNRAGLTTGPRIFSTGTILYGAAGSFRAEIESREDALRHLRRLKSVGAISVKSYNQPRREQRQWVVDAARELEMMVMPEGGSLFMQNMTMVLDGHTCVEHNIPVERAYDDVIKLWSSSEVGYTPTLVVCFGGIAGEHYWYQHDDVWADERLTRFVPRFIVDPRSRRRTKAPEHEYNHVRAAEVCTALQDAGVSVHVGAHGQMAGLAAHWEMWMLAQGGMAPIDVIRAATIDAATHLGMDRDIGSIEPGKLADLLVLDQDPLQDIRNSRHIRYTMINGRIYDARTMDQIGNHPDDVGTRWYGPDVQGVGYGRWWRDVAGPTHGAEDAHTGCAGCSRH